MECYLANLRSARAHFAIARPEKANELDALLGDAKSRLDSLRQQSQGTIWPRRRPKLGSKIRPADVMVYLDECGSHRLVASADGIDAFSITAVVIRKETVPSLQERWETWKREFYGTIQVKLHACDMLRGRGAFWFDGNRGKRAEATQALSALVRDLDFLLASVIVRRSAYLGLHGHGGMNDSLPDDVYHMVLDFLCERLVMGLYLEGQDGCAQVMAESRGSKEDALLQYEFARLHLDGTSYIPGGWFRHQFRPGVHFETKDPGLVGLELADLLGRACVEKVKNPESEPLWWTESRGKLLKSMETENSPLGIKVVPWSKEYERFWEK